MKQDEDNLTKREFEGEWNANARAGTNAERSLPAKEIQVMKGGIRILNI